MERVLRTVDQPIDLCVFVGCQVQFSDAEWRVELKVRHEKAVDERNQDEHERTHSTLAIGYRRERSYTLNRHEHEDEHGNLRVGRVVRQDRESIVFDQLMVSNAIDEVRQGDVEPARRRSPVDEHSSHVRNKQK